MVPHQSEIFKFQQMIRVCSGLTSNNNYGNFNNNDNDKSKDYIGSSPLTSNQGQGEIARLKNLLKEIKY
jgi:hypothetical protein